MNQRVKKWVIKVVRRRRERIKGRVRRCDSVRVYEECEERGRRDYEGSSGREGKGRGRTVTRRAGVGGEGRTVRRIGWGWCGM